MAQSSFNFNLHVFKVIFIQVEDYTFNFYLGLYISIDFQLLKHHTIVQQFLLYNLKVRTNSVMFTERNYWRKSCETQNITIRFRPEHMFSIYPRPKHSQPFSIHKKKSVTSGYQCYNTFAHLNSPTLTSNPVNISRNLHPFRSASACLCRWSHVAPERVVSNNSHRLFRSPSPKSTYNSTPGQSCFPFSVNLTRLSG